MISFLLRVTCVIFERAIITDVWQAMVARANESKKNSREPPKGWAPGQIGCEDKFCPGGLTT